MLRKIIAFLAYNACALLFVEAFQLDVPYVLDNDKVEQMRARGFVFEQNAWGWNDHYIYRLLAAVVATAGAAFLTGALVAGRARKKRVLNSVGLSNVVETDDQLEPTIIPHRAGWFAVIANGPSVIAWGILFYLMTDAHVLSDPSNVARTYFKWMCLIAIPVTSVVALWAGGEGAKYQHERFSDDTTLGIRPFHWVWATIPIYAYSVSIIAAGARFAQNMWYGWGQEGLLGTVLYLLTLIPLIAYFYPLQLSYRILSGERLMDRGRAVRAAAVAGCLTIGLLIAIALDFGSVMGLTALGYSGKGEKNPTTTYVVNTFEKWCEDINGEDLAKKNNKSQVEYDVGAIRVDYIEKLNNELTDNLKQDQPSESSLDERAIRQLREDRKFGAWQDQDASGIHLHIADFPLLSDSRKEEDAFEKWTEDYRKGLEKDRNNAEKQKESVECFFRTMDNLFDEVILHSGTLQQGIPLRHTARSYEGRK